MKLLLLYSICYSIFTIKFVKSTKTFYVVKGNPVTLECNTNSEQSYNTCKWNRPDNSATCGLFHSGTWGSMVIVVEFHSEPGEIQYIMAFQ